MFKKIYILHSFTHKTVVCPPYNRLFGVDVSAYVEVLLTLGSEAAGRAVIGVKAKLGQGSKALGRVWVGKDSKIKRNPLIFHLYRFLCNSLTCQCCWSSYTKSKCTHSRKFVSEKKSISLWFRLTVFRFAVLSSFLTAIEWNNLKWNCSGMVFLFIVSIALL